MLPNEVMQEKLLITAINGTGNFANNNAVDFASFNVCLHNHKQD